MDETVEKTRKTRSDKGQKRGTRKATAPMFTSAPEPEAPIYVRVTLRNGAKAIEFGCARRIVENGFHVFFYPSEIDRYRETRREFAISEIVEIEITEARRQAEDYGWRSQTVDFSPPQPIPIGPQVVGNTTGPQIHSARKSAQSLISALENSSGPIKMEKLPNLSFGNSEG